MSTAGGVGANWAGSYHYRARTLHRPTTVEQARHIIAAAPKIRALGTRHSFHDLPDSPGDLITLTGLDRQIRIDAAAGTVTVGAGVTYAALAPVLDRAGYALPAMASLPHITVAGAIATGTHGSGDAATGLAGAVVGLELIDAAGDLHHLRRGDPDFPGAVVSLGALGVVTRVRLRIEPAYRMRQHVLNDVPWAVVLEDFDAVSALGESVSVFTSWNPRTVESIWVKRRTDRPGGDLAPHLPEATPARTDQHPVPGADAAVCTPQMGLPGPWHERLPHFRPGYTPSTGAEIQVEYVLDRSQVVPALQAMLRIGRRLAPVLQIAEVRTIAADDLWLSPAFGRDSASVHLTLDPAPQQVAALLPVIDTALAPWGARPHWAKWFGTDPVHLERAYPMLPAFRDLVRRWDPDGCFGNDFLDRWVLGAPGARSR